MQSERSRAGRNSILNSDKKDNSARKGVINIRSKKNLSLDNKSNKGTPKHRIEETDKFVDILQAAKRNNADARAIYRRIKDFKFFLDNQKLFEVDLEEAAVYHICKHIKFEKYQADKLVYKKGDRSIGKILLVFKGEIASVEFKEVKEEKSESPTPTPATRTRRNNLLSVNIPTHSTFYSNRDNTPGNEHRDSKFEQQYHIIKLYQEGDYFGDESMKRLPFRNETIVAKTECMLLSIYQNNFEYVRNRFDKDTFQKLAFVSQYFPVSIAQDEFFLSRILKSFTVRELPAGAYVTVEGLNGDEFFMLFEGTCEIQKHIGGPEDKPKKGAMIAAYRTTPICVVEAGSLLGEEVLFSGNENCYLFSTKVTSNNAMFLVFDRFKFQSNFEEETLQEMKTCYDNKVEQNVEMYNYILSVRPVFNRDKLPEPILQENKTDSIKKTGNIPIVNAKRSYSQENIHTNLAPLVKRIQEASPKNRRKELYSYDERIGALEKSFRNSLYVSHDSSRSHREGPPTEKQSLPPSNNNSTMYSSFQQPFPSARNSANNYNSADSLPSRRSSMNDLTSDLREKMKGHLRQLIDNTKARNEKDDTFFDDDNNLENDHSNVSLLKKVRKPTLRSSLPPATVHLKQFNNNLEHMADKKGLMSRRAIVEDKDISDIDKCRLYAIADDSKHKKEKEIKLNRLLQRNKEVVNPLIEMRRKADEQMSAGLKKLRAEILDEMNEKMHKRSKSTNNRSMIAEVDDIKKEYFEEGKSNLKDYLSRYKKAIFDSMTSRRNKAVLFEAGFKSNRNSKSMIKDKSQILNQASNLLDSGLNNQSVISKNEAKLFIPQFNKSISMRDLTQITSNRTNINTKNDLEHILLSGDSSFPATERLNFPITQLNINESPL